MAIQRKPFSAGLPFPPIPERWGEEGRRFAFGLRDLMEQIRWQRAWPIGIVALSTRTDENDDPIKPFTFGEWEQVETGIIGIYGWRRTR